VNNPLTVRNPLNNEVISDEVRFFKLDFTAAASETLQAVFIGSDYHYSQSPDFRKLFLDNAVDSELLKIDGGPQQGSLSQAVHELLSENASRLRAQRFLQNLQFRSKNIMFHGAIFCFYFFAVLITLLIFFQNVRLFLTFKDCGCSKEGVRPGI